MSYRIIVDSCCELPEEYKNDERFVSIPLGLQVGDYMIEDDKKIVDFYKNHNEKRRPYYDAKGISMHYFLR